MSKLPAALAPLGYAPAGVVPARPLSRVLARALSHAAPQGRARPSIPRAARAHSASVGRRKTEDERPRDAPAASSSFVAVVSHSQNSFASFQLTSTTG